ncbi:MAG: hypothetical protein ACI892_001407, partial [Marinobacter maritimus]
TTTKDEVSHFSLTIVRIKNKTEYKISSPVELRGFEALSFEPLSFSAK